MGQPLLFQQGHGLGPHPGLLLGVQPEGGGQEVLFGPHMLGDQNVFKDGQGPEQPDILEGTGNAPVGDPVGGGVQLVGVEPLFWPR